jgi:hypothetical protein
MVTNPSTGNWKEKFVCWQWMNAMSKPEKFVVMVGETVSNDEKLTLTITETLKLTMVRWIA